MKSGLPSLAAAALFFTVACGGEPETSVATDKSETPPAVTAVFECAADDAPFAFTTRTIAHGLALWLPLKFKRPYVVLEQTPAASGARFEGEGAADGVVVWLHGEEAMLEVDGERFSGCRRNPQASIWEHAKLSGVDFRATGNEPGWVLEISERTSIDLSYDYGASRIQATASDPVGDQQARRTTWEANVDGVPLKLEITAVACTDSMSGEQFESTVLIYLSDRQLTGCGRALH